MRQQIFRRGTHVSSAGERLTFTEAQLRASAAAYDPSVHEAPIVVGHPRDNAPAYGWVGTLSYDEGAGALEAEERQIDPAFAELREAGRFKKRSASFYHPDSPSNPVPGVFYLRHVGYLGAQPPAVKGLRDAPFSEAEEGVVEFTDAGMLARLFRGLREYFIEQHDVDTADRVLPSYLVEDLAAESAIQSDASMPAYSDSADGGNTVTTTAKSTQQPAASAAQQTSPDADELARRQAEIDAREASFAEREQRIAAEERRVREREHAEFVESLVKDGRIMPRHQPAMTALLTGLPAAEIEFAEGDSQVKKAPADVLRDILTSLPTHIDYSERAGSDRPAPTSSQQQNPRALARKAGDRVEAARREGRSLSFTEAYDEVVAEARGADA